MEVVELYLGWLQMDWGVIGGGLLEKDQKKKKKSLNRDQETLH